MSSAAVALAGLSWIGNRARWVLAMGVLLALVLPGLSSALRPLLPAFVVLIFAVAAARLDVFAVVRSAAAPPRLLRLAALTLALLVATPVLLWTVACAAGASEAVLAAVVYTGVAPPITSAAGLCLLLGLEAGLALQLTVAASLAAPFLGPVVASTLLGAAVPIEPVALAERVAAMIGAGAALGIGARRYLGEALIARQAKAFDGIGALTMLVFVIPLFDGVWAQVLADPGRALGILGLAVAVNFGLQAAIALGARRIAGRAKAGAAGLAWGNRTVALYYAALPPDPTFGLYVALYQIPMLFTPLVMGPVLGAQSPRSCDR